MSTIANHVNGEIEKRSVAGEVADLPDLGEIDLSRLAIRLARTNVEKAFAGKHFSISPLKKVLRAADVLREVRGTGPFETLQVAHTVRWDRLDPADGREMAAVALRMMDLDGGAAAFTPGSRIRHLIVGAARPRLRTVLHGLEVSFREGRNGLFQGWGIRKGKAIDLCNHLEAGGEVVVENHVAAMGETVSERFAWSYDTDRGATRADGSGPLPE